MEGTRIYFNRPY